VLRKLLTHLITVVTEETHPTTREDIVATVTGKPYPGPFIFSLEDVRERLIDLPEGAMRGLRAKQAGIDGVMSELLTSVSAHGEEAGVSLRVYARVVDGTNAIDLLLSHEQALQKGLEVVRETRKKCEHDRENDISIIVDAVKSTAQRTGDKALLAAFERTIKYNGQIAEKAAQTRRRNADAPVEDEVGND
jgi:hypothetical protein